MDKNVLIMTVGLPRAGKSTWALKQRIPVVNPDSIRLAVHGQAFVPESERIVWTVANYMVKALFIAGHKQVILDATNTTRKRRDEWVSDSWVRKFMVFTADEETCKERSEESNRPDLIPVIERMASGLELVADEEVGEGSCVEKDGL